MALVPIVGIPILTDLVDRKDFGNITSLIVVTQEKHLKLTFGISMLGVGMELSTLEAKSLVVSLVKFVVSQMVESSISWWLGGIERRRGG